MAWHLEAVGSGNVRGTDDKRDDGARGGALRSGGEHLHQGAVPALRVPADREGRLADAAEDRLRQGRSALCPESLGEVRARLRRRASGGREGAPGRGGRVRTAICYQNVYLGEHDGGSGPGDLRESPRQPRVAGDRQNRRSSPEGPDRRPEGRVGAFNRYVCYVKPAAGDKRGPERLVDIEFARARTYYETRHYEEAALAFREMAVNHADSESGVYAAQLYLESLNVLATRAEPGKAACIDDDGRGRSETARALLQAPLPRRPGRTSRAGTGTRSSAPSSNVSSADLERIATPSSCVERAEFEKGALAYMAIWDGYGRAACEAKQPGCDRMEEVLYDAAKAFQAARLLAKAIAVRKILIDPHFNLHETEPARKAVYEIGANYQAIAVYDEAASYYEKFARESPSMENAAVALRDATVLRLGLGEEARRSRTPTSSPGATARSKPAQAAQIAFAIGAHYVDREDWAQAKRRLTGAMRQIDRSATLDVQIQAHALLGRASELNERTDQRRKRVRAGPALLQGTLPPR